MENFYEFLKTLDLDVIADEINEINRHKPCAVIANVSPESLGTLLAEIHKDSVISSVYVMLVYLRKYHEWLSEQL